MKSEVQRRVTAAAKYVIKTGATVRACAEAFGVSKTTIHKDMRVRLPMRGGAESLNAAVAAGIMMYELMRDL